MAQTNLAPQGRIAPTVPEVDTVRRWVALAKGLESKITY
jgi:hypothetical protein